MKKRGSINNKKALSPVIATVLLIALVVVLAAIVFLWARGFISEQIMKSGESIQNSCQKINFAVRSIPLGSDMWTLEISNRGNVPIYGFDIKGITGGNSKTKNFQGSYADKGQSVSVTLSLSEIYIDDEPPEKITLYPILLGNVKDKTSNKAYTCLDKGFTLNL